MAHYDKYPSARLDKATIYLDISVDGGKYRFVYHSDAKPPEAYRHGEPWPAFEAEMLGSKAIFALCCRIAELEGKA